MAATTPADGANGNSDDGALIAQLLQALRGEAGGPAADSGGGAATGGSGGGPSAAPAGPGSGPPQQASLLQALVPALGQGGAMPSAGGGGQPGGAGQQAPQGDVPLHDLLRMVVQHLGAPQQHQGGGSEPAKQPAPESAGGQPAPPATQIPLKDVLQLALAAGAGGAASPSGAGGASPRSSIEMQLSQELAGNLKKLKAILAETQDLAQRIETALGQQPAEAGSTGRGHGSGRGQPRPSGQGTHT